MHQADQIKFSLQDLLHRYEGAYAAQVNSMSEFKNTAAQANNLLGSLQASADSLKEMVRYEVGRAGSADRREIDELREQVRALSQRIDAQSKDK
jgi:ubiquinone biosynthesis protein UbiJ